MVRVESAFDEDYDDTLDPTVLEGAVQRAPRQRHRLLRYRAPICVVMLCSVVVLASLVGFLTWQYERNGLARTAALQSTSVASEVTVAMLSYGAGSAEEDLSAARDRLIGSFRDEYTKLINDYVIPSAKEQGISVRANVTAAAPISASDRQSVVLVFVNQTTTIGDGMPSDTTSTVKVTLNRESGQWLVSAFDPV